MLVHFCSDDDYNDSNPQQNLSNFKLGMETFFPFMEEPAGKPLSITIIGVGAGPAGPVWAGPLFQRFIIIDICAHHYRWRAIRTCLLQPDHFNSLPTPLTM